MSWSKFRGHMGWLTIPARALLARLIGACKTALVLVWHSFKNVCRMARIIVAPNLPRIDQSMMFYVFYVIGLFASILIAMVASLTTLDVAMRLVPAIQNRIIIGFCATSACTGQTEDIMSWVRSGIWLAGYPTTVLVAVAILKSWYAQIVDSNPLLWLETAPPVQLPSNEANGKDPLPKYPACLTKDGRCDDADCKFCDANSTGMTGGSAAWMRMPSISTLMSQPVKLHDRTLTTSEEAKLHKRYTKVIIWTMSSITSLLCLPFAASCALAALSSFLYGVTDLARHLLG